MYGGVGVIMYFCDYPTVYSDNLERAMLSTVCGNKVPGTDRVPSSQ